MTLAKETSIPARWDAIVAMSLCAGLLVASEFLPVSLLTPMSEDLGVTPGRAGQAISISGLFAVATSLLSPWITRGIDRRHVQPAYAVLMVLSATE
jgi:predicted MFS family arabinose efflux permease